MIQYVRYDGPLAHPGACVCGSQKRPVVDTVRELPGYGRVYLCELCVRMSALAFGWVDGDSHDRLRQQADGLAVEVERLTGELAAAHNPANRVVSVGELVDYLNRQAAEAAQQPQEGK